MVKIEKDLYILPSSRSNGHVASEIKGKNEQIKNTVKKVCNKLENLGFSLVVVDTSPIIGAFAYSTIYASDIIVIPVKPDEDSLRGLDFIISEISETVEKLKFNRPTIKILFSQYDGRDQVSEKFYQHLRKDPLYSKLLVKEFYKSMCGFW